MGQGWGGEEEEEEEEEEENNDDDGGGGGIGIVMLWEIVCWFCGEVEMSVSSNREFFHLISLLF